MVNKWKDPWFYYKAITAIVIIGSVVGVYLYHMILQTWPRAVHYPFSYWMFQGSFFAYFTYQSNFIVGVWFLIAAIYHNKPNKIADNQNIRLAVTCYIAVTCFIFVFVILPVAFDTQEQFDFGVVLGAIFFHIITPALMITYTLVHAERMKMTTKNYYHKSFWLYLIYPFLYTVYLALRLTIYSTVPNLKDVPIELVYPYLPMLPSHNIKDLIANNQYFLFLIIGFFIIVYLSFIVFNLIFFYSIKKLGKDRKSRKNIAKKKQKSR